MSQKGWWAKGLLFENCSCQVVCPAHISFKQRCTYERCQGYWGIHIREGSYGDSLLQDLNVVVAFDTPQRMYDGGWTEVFYIDQGGDSQQRQALELIFSGRAGGPWEVLGRFVEQRLESRFVPIHFEDRGRTKVLRVDGYLESEVTALRAGDGKGEVVLSNLYNVIHGPSHVLGRGTSRCLDDPIRFVNQGSHGLYSEFSWEGQLPARQ